MRPFCNKVIDVLRVFRNIKHTELIKKEVHIYSRRYSHPCCITSEGESWKRETQKQIQEAEAVHEWLCGTLVGTTKINIMVIFLTFLRYVSLRLYWYVVLSGLSVQYWLNIIGLVLPAPLINHCPFENLCSTCSSLWYFGNNKLEHFFY